LRQRPYLVLVTSVLGQLIIPRRRGVERDLPTILPVVARGVHCLNPIQQDGAVIILRSKIRPAQQRTPHRSAPAHTPTCRSKKLASTPPELAGACAAAPAAPRGPTAKLTSGRPRRAGGAHLAPRGRAAPGAGALCPPSGSRRGRASHRPLGCRWRRRRATAGRRCKAAPGTVRNFSTPLPREQRPGAATARGHIYLAQSTPVPVVVRARRTPQCPPMRYTSAAILPNCQEPKFRFYASY
jgi:hypothetical protein